MIEFLHTPTEDEPFAVIVKPRGIASAPLSEGEMSAYTQAAERFPQLRCVKGRKVCEHGLIHRIDTDTEGLLLIASSQDFYDYMECIQEQGKFIKSYKAVCTASQNPAEGYPLVPFATRCETPDGSIAFKAESRFRPYGTKNREVRPVTSDSGLAAQKKAGTAWYTTEICIKRLFGNTFFADCTLNKGYRHQVRCHLAWLGFPIIGDPLYAPNETPTEQPFMFWATKIQFPLQNGSRVVQKIFEYQPKIALA